MGRAPSEHYWQHPASKPIQFLATTKTRSKKECICTTQLLTPSLPFRTLHPGIPKQCSFQADAIVAWSADGSKIASVRPTDGYITLWDGTTFEPILLNINRQLENPSPTCTFVPLRSVHSNTASMLQRKKALVTFTPDSGKLVTLDERNQCLKLWDLTSLEHINDFACSDDTNGDRVILSVALSPDGRIFAGGTDSIYSQIDNDNDNGQTDVISDKEELDDDDDEDGSDGEGDSQQRSDEKVIFSGRSLVYLWNSDTAECIHVLQGHTGHVHSLVFSIDGNFLASGSGDYTVRIWALNTSSCIKVLADHLAAVKSLTYSADGRMLASGSDDGTVCIYDTIAVAYAHIYTITSSVIFISSIQFTPDSCGLIICSGYKHLRICQWDSPSMSNVQIFEGVCDLIEGIATSPDNAHFVSGGKDGSVHIWKLPAIEGALDRIKPKCVKRKRRHGSDEDDDGDNHADVDVNADGGNNKEDGDGHSHTLPSETYTID